MTKYSFHIRPMRNMLFLLTMLFLVLSSVVAFAAPDYVATVSCTGQPTLTPPDNIVRTQGETDAKEFELRADAGVTLKVKEWRLNGTSVTNTSMSNWGQFQLLSGNKTMNWTLGDKAEGEFTLTALIRRGCGDGGEGEDEEVDLWSGEVVATKLQLKSVTFGGGNHTIYRDKDFQAAYPSPHWEKDRTEEGLPFQSPVCYTRNSQISVSATFSVTPKDADQTIKVKGVANDYTFGPVDITPKSGSATFPVTEADTALPNSIRPGDSFNIIWYFSTDNGENWELAGDSQTEASSANQLYVTLVNPNVPKLFHTLVHIACTSNEGQSEKATIANNIWGEFTDNSVIRVDSPVQLSYWPNGFNSEEIFDTNLLLSHGNGRCGAWSRFFQDALSVHGIGSTNWGVVPDIPRPGPAPDGYPSYRGARFFIAATQAQGNNGPLVLDDKSGDGLPAHFGDHAVVELADGDSIYDPSYGLKWNSKEAWEAGAISTFAGVYYLNDHDTYPYRFVYVPNTNDIQTRWSS